MPEKKADPTAPVTPQSFEAVAPEEPKLSAEERRMAEARAEEQAKQDRLAVKAETARFIRVKQDA